MSRTTLSIGLSGLVFRLLASVVILAVIPAATADQISPDLVPPDVTVPASPYSVPSQGFGSYQPGANVSPAAPGQPGAPGQTGASGPAAAAANEQDQVAVITTSKGAISIRLFSKYAPNTVQSFVELCNKGFYDGLTFHRVEPGFVIQGGDPNGNGSGVYVDPATNQPRFINLEVSPHLRHNAPGVVAMARFGKNPNTASCQFYITLAPQPKLDNQYSIFGGVVQGMDVAKQIEKGDKIISIKIQGQ